MQSSLVGKLETNIEIKAAASKFHEIFKHPHRISNISPNFVQSCELLQGQWGTEGSVIFWKYFLDGKHSVSKELMEVVDDKNKSLTFKVIEGDLLKHYKNFKFILKTTPKGSDQQGSVVQWTLEYEKPHNGIVDPHSMIQVLIKVSKDIDIHLINTP
ncbi:hypothetical protein FEM48_Zijuj10G0123600 [Ziziphus jujuba var. spinosa]|uniref:Bet v I/Major latex protein domain-containing protein n=1 Tax=Ziziphus jujuba var. spinosa TaxID=714518 RepID=A0A978UNC8_ZIZJJ|nr:hypothetical protein FEM48_Zijuj10G0123600 [Ziziphus jujuba var. spinosa]